MSTAGPAALAGADEVWRVCREPAEHPGPAQAVTCVSGCGRARWAGVQNKTHALNDEVVVNALAGVVGVGVTYIKDDSDIVPLLKARQTCGLPNSW